MSLRTRVVGFKLGQFPHSMVSDLQLVFGPTFKSNLTGVLVVSTRPENEVTSVPH